MHQFHKVKGTYNHQEDDCFLSYERDLLSTHVFNLIVFFLCIYSILAMLAAIFGLFNIAKAMDKIQNK